MPDEIHPIELMAIITLMQESKMKVMRHAEIPVHLYGELIKLAADAAVNGDATAFSWLINERAIRMRETALKEWEGIRHTLSLDGQTCVECNEKADTWDHIHPISRGGSNNPSNIQPMCRLCNSKKHNNIDLSNAVEALKQELGLFDPRPQQLPLM